MSSTYVGERRSSDDNVCFLVEEDGRQSWWKVSGEALEDRLGANGASDFLATFDQHSAAIHLAAQQKAARGDLEEDGSVHVKAIDCRGVRQ